VPGQLTVPSEEVTVQELVPKTGVVALVKAQVAPIIGVSLQKSTINSCSVVTGLNDST